VFYGDGRGQETGIFTLPKWSDLSLYEARGGEGDSEAAYLVAGLSCLSRSSNQTNETDRKNQMDPIPATRRRMFDYKTGTHFLGAAMFIPGT
jgi:hypothetical protein